MICGQQSAELPPKTKQTKQNNETEIPCPQIPWNNFPQKKNPTAN